MTKTQKYSKQDIDLINSDEFHDQKCVIFFLLIFGVPLLFYDVSNLNNTVTKTLTKSKKDLYLS